MRPLFACLLALTPLLALAACGSREPGDEVWAEVNGQPIYRSQVERYYEAQVSVLPESLTPAEELSRKLSILTGLIQEEILWQRAIQAGLQPGDAEVEARLQELRLTYSEEEMQQQLNAAGATAGDLKAALRREMAIRTLFDRALKAGLEVSEQEVREYYQQHPGEFRLVEAQLHVAHILVTPRLDPDVRNLRNDDAANETQAREKTQRLLQRLRTGDDFADLARAYSEDPTTALSGGDLGFFPESTLQGTHPALRSALQGLAVGEIAGPLRTSEGYEIIRLLEREAPGQRDLADPRVQEDIRERLQSQKRKLLEAAYVARARNQARVVNYLAREILESGRVAP